MTSMVIEEFPVTLAPGRARLATRPAPTGSPTLTITIGIVLVAFLAANDACVTTETITSTLSRTNSAASCGSRSNLPSANRYRFCGPAAPALHLPVSRIRGRGRIAELWREHHRCLSQLRRLYREDSQRRKTRRSTGAAADQVRDGNQSQDRRGARHQNLRQSTLARRRGDRIRAALLRLLTAASGTSRQFAATQHFGRFRSEAD